MNTTIKVNGNDTLSGSFISSIDSRNEILFDNGELVRVIFTFNRNTKDMQIKPSFSGGGKDTELIVLLELPWLTDSSQGIVSPMELAKLDDGRLVSFQLWVRKIAEPYIEIVYSFYIRNAN